MRTADGAVRTLDAPREVGRIARVLEDAGFSTWAVGGAVRDALAGLPVVDWDLTTAARPGDVRRLFRRTVPIGIEHGTVGVFGKDGVLYEVTTFRRDVETFGRHAVVSFADSIEDDLSRRDFTINAVAWHPLSGEVRDPFGGVEDLQTGVLRTVGEPEERFREDRLRMLRALRFAGRYALEIEPATWAAIRTHIGAAAELSAERVREELLKALGAPGADAALALYGESGALAVLYPELEARHHEPGAWPRILAAVTSIPPHRRLVRLAALLHDLGAEDGPLASAARARELLRRLKTSNADTDYVTHLVAQHAPLPPPDAPAPELRRWLRRIGPDVLPDLFRLRIALCRAEAGPDAREHGEWLIALWRRARSLVRERPPLGVGELAIGGAELRELGLPPGPLYGEILSELLERVTDEPELNERELLMELVRERIG
jgi:tRNA nucleotidyltransferase/poly(A) polymerase